MIKIMAKCSVGLSLTFAVFESFSVGALLSQHATV